MVGELLPVGSLDQGDDATRIFWRPTVVLTGGEENELSAKMVADMSQSTEEAKDGLRT